MHVNYGRGRAGRLIGRFLKEDLGERGRAPVAVAAQ
jgi:hypothetical protein